MFLNIIKYKSLKKAVNLAVKTSLTPVGPDRVKTIGVVLDKKDLGSLEVLLQAFIAKGFKKDAISFLIYGVDKTVDSQGKTYVRDSDFSNLGELKNQKVRDFVQTRFDLLVNFYDIEALVLLWISSHSKAELKVGFSSIGAHVNNFSIALVTDRAKEFVEELCRYLEIFKKK